MNQQGNPDLDAGPQQRPVDKTFVEGGMTGINLSNVKPGTRVNATSLGATNPYGQQPEARSQAYGADLLPTGNDPIPLGSGTVVGLLGSGGMAKVYKVWNEKLEVFRAVKVLLPSQQVDLRNRFETEAKITAKLHHPNIVEIYNVGDWNNLPYLEMEFVEGESLEAFIVRNGKLPDAVCSSIAIFVVRALSYAHSQEFLIYGKNYHGVIHRDLKPANIMIASSGEVRLMDFGIARPTEASLHTVEGNIVGTMQYLSPEQMDGVDIDCRTDIYSFGAILYEMLTGTKTFPQDTITNLMKRKIMNEYRRFSDFDFSISPGLAKIAQKCLQLSKEDRYSSAEMLLKDLETVHRSIAPEPPGKMLRRYAADPDSLSSSSATKRLPSWLGPKILIPVAGAAVLAGIVSVVMITGPSLKDSDEAKRTIAQANTEPEQTATKPAAPTMPATESLQPLAPAPAAQTSPSQPSKPVEPAQPRTPVATAAPRKEVARPPAKVPPPPPRQSSESTAERLRHKYDNTNMMDIAKTAVRANAYTDAIAALEEVPENHPESNLRMLLLLESYVETGKTKDALFIVNSQNIADAQFDFYSGRLYQLMGKDKAALDLYQSALTKPSIVRSRNEIRNDALYYTAMVWSDHYRDNSSSESRLQALNAWNIVKRSYSSNPNHPRFRKANTELASIQ